MQALPSREYFTASTGHRFSVTLASGDVVELELHQVEERVAMHARCECFSLLFLLPPGVSLPQALYRVAGPSGESWQLLLTPVRPDAAGRCRLEAVFHREKPRAPMT